MLYTPPEPLGSDEILAVIQNKKLETKSYVLPQNRIAVVSPGIFASMQTFRPVYVMLAPYAYCQSIPPRIQDFSGYAGTLIGHHKLIMDDSDSHHISDKPFMWQYRAAEREVDCDEVRFVGSPTSCDSDKQQSQENALAQCIAASDRLTQEFLSKPVSHSIGKWEIYVLSSPYRCFGGINIDRQPAHFRVISPTGKIFRVAARLRWDRGFQVLDFEIVKREALHASTLKNYAPAMPQEIQLGVRRWIATRLACFRDSDNSNAFLQK